MTPLPERRTTGFKESIIVVSSSSGFILKRVFFTPCRRAYRLRVHRYDDRLQIFLGGSYVMTRQRGKPRSGTQRGHVVDYHQVIHSHRRKPMTLLNLVYCDQLFFRPAYQRSLFSTQYPKVS